LLFKSMSLAKELMAYNWKVKDNPNNQTFQYNMQASNVIAMQ